MHNRTLRSRLLTILALPLLAAAAVQMPQFASLAQAGTLIGTLRENDIIKLKTNWGGGYVLNIGGTAGTTSTVEVAKVHFNTGWDSPNRFLVASEPFVDQGFSWVMLKNRFSGLCLSVEEVEYQSYVVQKNCNFFDNKQYWARRGEGFGIGPSYINRSHRLAGLNSVLTQVTDEVGSYVRMDINTDDINRQSWNLESCKVNGVEQQHC